MPGSFPTAPIALNFFGSGVVGVVREIRFRTGELLNGRIALAFEDDALDLGVLVIEGDGEPGPVGAQRLLLAPSERDTLPAVGISALARRS